MATTEGQAGVRGFLTASRPLGALAAVWLTTAGHTMNFREMNAAHGWIAPEGYSLHSAYLFAAALALSAAPAPVRLLGSHVTALLGLVLLATASLANGLMLHAPWPIFVAGRVLAGTGAGLVIFAAPRLLDTRWERPAAWAAILLPALGPLVIAGASILYGWSSWEGGFLFEAVLAVFGLALLVSMESPAEKPLAQAPPIYLPALAVGTASVWYVQHWGQLHGWLESTDILVAMTAGIAGYALTVLLAAQRLESPMVRHGVPRLLLVGYAGFVQFFNVTDMGVYGGLLVNFSAWQRAVLIWSLSVGAASALVLGEILWRGRRRRLRGALAGLLVLAAGMALARHNTLSWPFWSILNQVDLNWFAAPLYWELAPARFLMGFGSALLLLSATTHTHPDPAWETQIVPRLREAQFAGGALSIGVLSTALLAGHQWEYAYAADRGFIQPQEVSERQARLAETLAAAGEPFAQRQAEVLMFRAVNYQADNLLFADIYAAFTVASLVIAALVLCWLLAAETQ